MKQKVLAIGLDAADPSLLEKWMAEGLLPNLSQLKNEGIYSALENFSIFTAETPWTTFLTGVSPAKTGFWGDVDFYPENYQVQTDIQAYSFKEYQPFYQHLPTSRRTIVFDVPQSRTSDADNAIEVTAWGAHSPMFASQSNPTDLWEKIQSQHGASPILHDDYSNCYRQEEMNDLFQRILVSIERRTNICLDFIQNYSWDLLITVFGETHVAGHNFWHLSQDHPLLKSQNSEKDLLLKTYQKIDEEIGRLAAACKDTCLVIFSPHGMKANNADLASLVFLPEFLYRYSFPGEIGLGAAYQKEPFTNSPVQIVDVWESKFKRSLPRRMLCLLERMMNARGLNLQFSRKGRLVHPFFLMQQKNAFFWMPPYWYYPSWPKMKAFALPSFSNGYVRINVEGREAGGIVSSQDFNKVKNEIEEELRGIKDFRTNQSLVKEIISIREKPNENQKPPADLVIQWGDQVTDLVKTNLGAIGSFPYMRTGEHQPSGFMLIHGAKQKLKLAADKIHALDLAPTIMSLLQESLPSYFEGKSVIQYDQT